MSDFYTTAAHVLPETASDEWMHVLNDRRWCHPLIDTDAWQIQHQRPTPPADPGAGQ